MQFLKVVERAFGCADHVSTTVIPPVLLHAEFFAGGRHKLPDAGSTTSCICAWIKGAFYHRQQGDFARHAATFHFFRDVVEIAARAIGHAREVIGMVDIPFFMLGDQWGMEFAYRETVAYARP